MNKDIVIETFDLTKYYGKTKAIDHISFNVKKGEIFGFLGPNGAGKTTTIRILTGLSSPTFGRAYIFGYDIKSDITKIKRKIGVVPELSNLYDDLSAMENLLFMSALYGVPRRERRKRAEELLKIFGLYNCRDDLFSTFSRGMKRALTIGAALIHKPKVIFLDEPTVGLDVIAARSLRNLLESLRKQEITIFLTTHYLEEADLLCDRIAILVNGKVVKIDTPKSLKAMSEKELIIECCFNREISHLIKDLIIPNAKIIALDHNKIRIYGGTSTQIYETIFLFAKNKSIEIESINSIKPSLEDAFIKTTGLSPILMKVEKAN